MIGRDGGRARDRKCRDIENSECPFGANEGVDDKIKYDVGRRIKVASDAV